MAQVVNGCWAYSKKKGVANKMTIRSRIVFQSMKCPRCGNLELTFPPASWEVIEDGSVASCMQCSSNFEIKIELQTRSAKLPLERQKSIQKACPDYFHEWEINNTQRTFCPDCGERLSS